VTPIFLGTVNAAGQLQVTEAPQYSRHLERLKGRGELEVIVRVRPARATWNQHKFYRGVVLPLIAWRTGFTEREAHIWMKAMFMPMRFHAPERLGSTAQLNRRQFAAYLEFVLMFAEGWLEIDFPPAERVLEAREEPALVSKPRRRAKGAAA
jgi:hypothetical protein